MPAQGNALGHRKHKVKALKGLPDFFKALKGLPDFFKALKGLPDFFVTPIQGSIFF